MIPSKRGWLQSNLLHKNIRARIGIEPFSELCEIRIAQLSSSKGQFPAKKPLIIQSVSPKATLWCQSTVTIWVAWERGRFLTYIANEQKGPVNTVFFLISNPDKYLSAEYFVLDYFLKKKTQWSLYSFKNVTVPYLLTNISLLLLLLKIVKIWPFYSPNFTSVHTYKGS